MIQRYDLGTNPYASLSEGIDATPMMLDADTGRYVEFAAYEREVAELKRLLMEWRDFGISHINCKIFTSCLSGEKIDDRCDLCKRTDSALSSHPPSERNKEKEQGL